MGIDTWLYHGYFLNLRHHVPAFAGTYYGSRLAWILPGALVYSLFKALTANLVLRLFLLTVSILAVFWQVQRRHGTRVSFLVSLLACGCPTLLSAIGWDYVDGPVIAYGLCCVEELDAALCLFENDRSFWHQIGRAHV